MKHVYNFNYLPDSLKPDVVAHGWNQIEKDAEEKFKFKFFELFFTSLRHSHVGLWYKNLGSSL